jgi:hypothetical protein
MPKCSLIRCELSPGEAFANASAAKPVSRKTAETLLQQFLERLGTVNSSPDYVYRVENAVLFGNMVSEAERLPVNHPKGVQDGDNE